MKCIDAIEGTAKKIISQMHAVFIDDCLDDSEFIRNIKAVIEATDQFLQDNPELIEDRQLLKQVLYSYSRDLWLMGQRGIERQPSEIKEDLTAESEEYQTYYYDYLYNHGLYPR